MSAIRSMPVTRRPVHTRRIECAGYERSDGLFDIEGHMIDTKADDANLIFKVVPAGSPIHDMRIVVTVDSRLVIHRIEARTEAAPSRYCAEINAAYACLAGVAIGAGFMKEVRRRLAGASGCTHLSELLGPIATTAIQTLIGLRASGKVRQEQSDQADMPMLDTCHAWRADGEVVRFVSRRKREREASRIAPSRAGKTS
ncbi:DUF2889 domain-containing protein [Caballeronia sp. LP006]|uniref:DUF2889 domain-containing protein n=1 Tax=Caballeronia sp. LP006 TaxID=3038552 RepID=UPI00285FC382|nr:DUF2889 domain-containing protein [Caballeronia sp. LP006]MDR5827945.1 DUF2889 domain-containing protein [Caballeronia sp. LP006]